LFCWKAFGPPCNWRVNYECISICIVVDVDPKNPIIPPYCGLRSMCPSLNIVPYTPFHDLLNGNFVIVQHLNLTIYLVWMERAKSDVVKDQDNENYKKVYVQW
jgi:hypothetical protein